MLLQGRCFCGAVRYEAEGRPSHETNCHCSICRRTSGAPSVAWFSVPKSSFRFILGVPARFHSTAKGARTFCSRCGTPLTFEHADFPDELDITTGSLDNPNLLPPKDHTHTSSKLSWMVLNDGLPAYLESRYEG
ncbi:MAG: GFA family protein [Cyanobacteria bacterium P01_D01_bin.71]